MLVQPPVALRDRTGDALTHHLTDAGLWRYGAQMELVRDGSKITVRVFLPEYSQGDRELGRIEASTLRAALATSLHAEGYAVLMSDSLWCERGTKQWVVLAKAVQR